MPLIPKKGYELSLPKRTLSYVLLVVLAATGAVASIRFGPGKVAPQVTYYTALCLLVLVVGEYLVWHAVTAKGQRVPIGKNSAILLLLGLGLIPQLICFLIVSFIWPVVVVLAALAILLVGSMLVRAYLPQR